MISEIELQMIYNLTSNKGSFDKGFPIFQKVVHDIAIQNKIKDEDVIIQYFSWCSENVAGKNKDNE